MTDPKKQHVIGKKPIVAERTLTERSFCEIDHYYYSEMFTCPICYGRDTENERIIKLLEALKDTRPTEETIAWGGYSIERMIELIKGEQK